MRRAGCASTIGPGTGKAGGSRPGAIRHSSYGPNSAARRRRTVRVADSTGSAPPTGLTVRYLGLALGTSMALGYCAAFGTLLPPIFSGQITEVIRTTSGMIVMAGVAVCMFGIAISGLAGISKERELPESEKKAAIKEFSFVKGVWVATFCGIMSACMSYGFAAGKPIAALAVSHGASEFWKNLPVLIIVLARRFTTNLSGCLGA